MFPPVFIMRVVHTEFGRFETIEDEVQTELYLKHEDKEFLIGWVKFQSTGGEIDASHNDDAITTNKIIDQFIQSYIEILRAEVKLAMFGQLPIGNKFKDAVLRMQIELTGQTYEIRPFVKEYNKMFAWHDYPETADLWSIEEYRDTHDIVFRCSYGVYLFENFDQKNSTLVKITEKEKVVADIYIPYNTENEGVMILAAKLQAIDAMVVDILDQIQAKKNEMIKHVSESIKYMFGFDKLRSAMRNRALS